MQGKTRSCKETAISGSDGASVIEIAIPETAKKSFFLLFPYVTLQLVIANFRCLIPKLVLGACVLISGLSLINPSFDFRVWAAVFGFTALYLVIIPAYTALEECLHIDVRKLGSMCARRTQLLRSQYLGEVALAPPAGCLPGGRALKCLLQGHQHVLVDDGQVERMPDLAELLGVRHAEPTRLAQFAAHFDRGGFAIQHISDESHLDVVCKPTEDTPVLW